MNTPLRKITIKNLGFSIAKVRDSIAAVEQVEGVPRVAPLFKIVGQSTEAKTGQSALGAYTSLLGSFTAVNLQTGEIYTSSKCILPNFISEGMGAALHTNNSVEFAIEIQAMEKADSISGYEYTAKNLIEMAPTDTMKRLLSVAGIGTTPIIGSYATQAPTLEPQKPAQPANPIPSKSKK